MGTSLGANAEACRYGITQLTHRAKRGQLLHLIEIPYEVKRVPRMGLSRNNAQKALPSVGLMTTVHCGYV